MAMKARMPGGPRNTITSLAVVAQTLLPTPRASANENRQTKRTPSQEAGDHGLCLAAEVLELLPGRASLPSAELMLPTPTVSDGTGGHMSRSGDRSGELLLAGIVRELSVAMRQQSGSMSESSAG